MLEPDGTILQNSQNVPRTISFLVKYYVVAPDGTVEAYSGVEPLQLKDLVLGKLSTDEL